VLEERGVGSVLIEPDTRLALALSYSPGWEAAYSDDLVVVYARKDSSE